MTHPERTDTRRADAAAKAAADLPDDEGNRALALLIACLLTPYGYGDPVLVAEWILGDKPPIDRHLDNLQGEFLADTVECKQCGRFAFGVTKCPACGSGWTRDAEKPLGDTDADHAAGWYAAAMGWKTRAEGAEAALAQLRKEGTS